MDYKELSFLYHMDTGADRDKTIQTEYKRRFYAASTFRTGFVVDAGELFIAVPKELSLAVEQTMRLECRIIGLLSDLPALAKSALLRSLVLDEVVSSNAIEDIHSTRRQVRDAIETEQAKGDNNRFKEFATLYLNIIDGVDEVPRTPADIRSVYDCVTAGESDEQSLPDGRFFRKEGVEIIGSGGKVIHRGLYPEKKITQAIKDMISLTRNTEIPALYSTLASHYVFEYIHPFYDGNGRTGRYLLSLMLSKVLSVPTALSLSRAMAENRTEYYRAFKSADDGLNRGELTFFVYKMLDLVQAAQLSVIARLEKSRDDFDALSAAIDLIAEKEQLKQQEKEFVFLLLQHEVFGLLDDMPLSELALGTRLKEQMARKHIAALEEKGICEKRRKYSPISFALTPAFKQKYAKSHLSFMQY